MNGLVSVSLKTLFCLYSYIIAFFIAASSNSIKLGRITGQRSLKININCLRRSQNKQAPAVFANRCINFENSKAARD